MSPSFPAIQDAQLEEDRKAGTPIEQPPQPEAPKAATPDQKHSKTGEEPEKAETERVKNAVIDLTDDDEMRERAPYVANPVHEDDCYGRIIKVLAEPKQEYDCPELAPELFRHVLDMLHSKNIQIIPTKYALAAEISDNEADIRQGIIHVIRIYKLLVHLRTTTEMDEMMDQIATVYKSENILPSLAEVYEAFSSDKCLPGPQLYMLQAFRYVVSSTALPESVVIKKDADELRSFIQHRTLPRLTQRYAESWVQNDPVLDPRTIPLSVLHCGNIKHPVSTKPPNPNPNI
ncbi:hypothetical protein G7Y89_g12773 [Cudoniella acicularis]|uniref:Uncharacterized protein n=1 Tax=Cudoniella acicularis TaxID=354080 RepID=A0A8H4VYU8_9HELO|nr:hypothetical protein G7Y89_g12773 [Cudoniella acicularis]